LVSGEGAAAREGAEIAEGIIAKEAKNLLKDAEQVGAKDAAEGAAKSAGKDAAKTAEQEAALKAAVKDEYERVRSTMSNREHGPVLTGALDRETGQIHFGLNSDEIPSPLHPDLQARLGDVTERIPFKGVPGAHSEVDAINKGLFARPGAKIEDFLVHNVRLKGAEKGLPITKCGHCAIITRGAREV
jgi:hypothetical protein